MRHIPRQGTVSDMKSEGKGTSTKREIFRKNEGMMQNTTYACRITQHLSDNPTQICNETERNKTTQETL